MKDWISKFKRKKSAAHLPWEKNKLFTRFTSEELLEFKPLLDPFEFKAGEFLMHEQDPGDCFYIIESGKVKVFKEDERFIMAELEDGESVGLMSVVDNEPRSASVKAITDIKAYRISADKFKALLKTSRKKDIYYKVLNNYLKLQQDYLRDTNNATVKALKSELEAANKIISIGSLFAFTVISLAFYLITVRFILEDVKLLSTSTFVTSGLLLLLCINVAIYIKISGFKLKEYGLNLKNWQKALVESVLWTLVFIAFATLIKWTVITYFSHIPGPLLEMPLFKISVTFAVITIATYAIFCFLQEFIFRGVMQGSLERVLGGKNVAMKAILLSTLMFCMAHVHLPNPVFPLLVIIPSLFWGFLYARHQTLLGVVVSHMMIGIWVLAFLGIPGIQ